MSIAVALSRGLAGADAPLVSVEVHLAGGLPAFNLVGLADAEVRESKDRVRSALQNAQFDFPARKIKCSYLRLRRILSRVGTARWRLAVSRRARS